MTSYRADNVKFTEWQTDGQTEATTTFLRSARSKEEKRWALCILLDGKCPAYVIKFLVYLYQEQRLCVKWDGMTSDTFPVCNGLKQGGILSPKLYNIYVDVLSQHLNKVMVGCCMYGKVINHLYYADDHVLLSPSAHGMQKLISECQKYASEYGTKFNEYKSVVLNFKG